MTKEIRPANSIEQFANFARSAESTESIQSFLSLLPRPPQHARFREYVIFSTNQLTDVLENVASRSNTLRPINARASAFRLTVTSSDREHEAKGEFVVLSGTQPHIFRLLTISYNAFWSRGIRKLVRSLYPYAMPVFFKQNEIKEALIALERVFFERFEVGIVDATMKKKRGENTHVARELDTERIWTDLKIRDVFDQASERNEWFTSIQFKLAKRSSDTDRSEVMAYCRVSKQGELNYDFLHDEISLGFLPTLEKQSSVRLTLLQNRGLKERNYVPSRPIEITFPSDIFADVEEIRRFGKVIAEFPNATKAILHSNPYYHASIADFLDGSSFELWILSANKVLIMPQAKSSQQAFQRLIAHVFFEFREGVLGEYNQQ